MVTNFFLQTLEECYVVLRGVLIQTDKREKAKSKAGEVEQVVGKIAKDDVGWKNLRGRRNEVAKESKTEEGTRTTRREGHTRHTSTSYGLARTE
jgi:hypothetical protein